ncbi:ADP-dependent NAD(P)H-hydrate dehydratase [Microbacterium hominis]|uniref:ADP-dependent (S)-NAD(P)H-hydrate dehydratase n=1 Tax=Microbacterium hominis TaxID=162426 RepID=A0A7D4TP00_9MICO|nr:ADP/ATP-dependent (S)-NAD(P)H-hydrate dehydratase [Microbacterium hominis]QKJ19962.1 NAD(P)H-hydrate dehydratase [Microbacterium hominis]
MSVTWNRTDTAQVLRRPTGDDDKYSRGVLGVRTGSQRYPGAAVLGVEAAWRTGVGMVRYLGPDRPTALVLARRPETVVAAGRVQAWLIGSGTDAADRDDDEAATLGEVLAGPVPVVVDAGALDLAPAATAPLIVTPHAGEHARLRSALGLAAPTGGDAAPGLAARIDAAAETARALRGVVVLKGAQTVVAAPDAEAIVVDAGTPWLAAAGTGDVLAGAIGAVVAGTAAHGEALARAAAAGVWLHGRAATLAAGALGPAGGPITASDVAAALPRAVAEALAR